jgi:predicted NAD/FAD-dependent oxidoreductase
MKRDEHKALATGESVTLADQANVVTITADTTLTAGDSGKVFLVGTDALVITLPSTQAALEFTFVNSGAAGNNIITISPQAADGIAGTITLASSVVTRVGTVDTDLVNTKASSTKGNSVKIVGTGVAGTGAYYIVSSTGIWA